MVSGPMRATIATLLDLGWAPVAPDAWIEPAPSNLQWHITGPGDYGRLRAAITRTAMKAHWKDASMHFAGKGMYSDGISEFGHGPDIHTIKKQLNSYEKYDRPDRNVALLCAATGATWPRARKKECDSFPPPRAWGAACRMRPCCISSGRALATRS